VIETTSTSEADSDMTGPAEVLVFHKTTGFRHESIPNGIAALQDLGDQHGFAVTATDDASVFTEEGLALYDVIVFLSTTGDILNGPQEAAMEGFIRAGNGFVGVHSASDTEYEWPWYGDLVGAYFGSHPAPQEAHVTVVEPEHPIMEALPVEIDRFDEWYNFQSFPQEVVVLATLEETSYEGGTMGDLHPITWAHEFDGGRSFYTAFGHTNESYAEPLVLDLLAGAIRWVDAAP
jgi:cytochrome c